jgi:hypothetical protein
VNPTRSGAEKPNGRGSDAMPSYSSTSLSGSANGSERRSTPFTTLKMAVLAPIASASVAMTSALNSGARTNWRQA